MGGGERKEGGEKGRERGLKSRVRQMKARVGDTGRKSRDGEIKKSGVW